MSGKSGQTVVDRLQAAIHTIDGSEMAKTVCKASTHEMAGPKPKHLTALVNMSKSYNVNQPELINLIILRTKEKSWIVVLKALVTCHHLMIFGSEKVFQVMAARSIVFSLDGFSDHMAYDMSTFIRTYSNYLNERSFAYRSMAGDFCRMKRGEDNSWKKMDDLKLIESVSILQSLLDKLTNCNPSQLRNPVIISAFELIYKDIIKMFSPYNESMIQIMERLTKMRLTQAKPAFENYKKFLNHLSTFKTFFDQAASIGIAKSDIPDIQEGPAKLLPMFEKHLEDLEAGRVQPDSSSSSPVKTGAGAGAGSATTSPTAGMSLAQQVLEEEKRALESYNKGRSNQSPTQAAIKLPQPTNPVKPPPPEAKPDYSADLLNLGSEITFGAATLNNINQQPANPAPTNNDPFSSMFSQPAPAATSNPFEAVLNSNPPAASQNSNPFANPFAAAAQPAPAASPFAQPNFMAAPQPTQNTNAFASFNQPNASNLGGLPGNNGMMMNNTVDPNANAFGGLGMMGQPNNNTMAALAAPQMQAAPQMPPQPNFGAAAPVTSASNNNLNNNNSSAFSSDPFSSLMQPGGAGAASGPMSAASKTNSSAANNGLGNNLDDALNNMMNNFNLAPNGNSNQNNPFAI